MTITRIFAIVASTLLLVLLAAGLTWLITIQRVESGLLSVLHNAVGVQVEFGEVKYHRNLAGGHITMTDVNLRLKIGDILYKHDIGTIDVRRGFLGDGRLKIDLPPQQKIHLKHDNGTQKTYTIAMEGGQLTFLGNDQNNRLKEAYFSSKKFSVVEEKQGPVVTAGNAYVLFEDDNDTYRVSLNRANINPWWHNSRPVRLESFLIDFSSARLPGFTRTLVLPFLMKESVAEVAEDIRFFISEAQAVRGLFTLNALKITLEEDVWFSADGDFALDKKNRPWGNLGFTSNEIEGLIARLPEFGVEETALKSYSFRRTLPKSSIKVVDVDTRTGYYKVNGIKAGEVQPLTTLFE